MMCAAHAGPSTLVMDHAKRPGEKIRISGGGRCNFTNMHTTAANFLGGNPHFPKSALSRYTQWDFIDLISTRGIAWHEKALGQLFCDGKATQIVDMLRDMLAAAGAELRLQCSLVALDHRDGRFHATLEQNGTRSTVVAENLVLATGGKSIPKMGATGLAYDIARQFGLPVTETRPALVPLTFPDGRFDGLAGVALPTRIRHGGTEFEEAMLFTHRGLSGPAILQISSYWQEGDAISINLSPGGNLYETLRARRQVEGRKNLTTELAKLLPARLVDHLAKQMDLSGNLADWSDKRLTAVHHTLCNWPQTPTGCEGYRTAEVTLGGIDTAALNSKTMAATKLPGLYVIGEAVDVTGWLGGYNFQWAWSSGMAAARAITA